MSGGQWSFVAIGAGVGAILGSGAGFGAWKISNKKRGIKPKPNEQIVDKSVKEPSIPKRSSKFKIFGFDTYYLSHSNNFYSELLSLNQYLQFEEEKEVFGNIIAHIDNLLGLDYMLTTQEPITKEKIPSFAQSARNSTKKCLDVIIKFSDEKRPSPTKKKSMTEVANGIVDMMDDMIKNMHRMVAL